MYDDIMK